MIPLTILPIPDDALANFTVPAGTVVYINNQSYQLIQNWQVNIESRDVTNYDNQRRATDPETGQHLFWVKGPFATAQEPSQ